MRNIVLTLILFSGIVANSKAQQFIASFGVQQSWGVPLQVTRMVHDHYHGYEWVHANRAYRHGSMFFDLVLQRGDIFVEVSVRNDGYISRRVVTDYYPLHDHVCSTHCGYHNTYYNTYYKSCNSHHHNGHNHVVVYNQHPPYGNAHGYYKNDKHHGKGYYKDQKHGHYNSMQSTRVIYRNNDQERSRGYESRGTIERRDRYYGSRSYEQDRRSENKYSEHHDHNRGDENKYRGHDQSRDHNKDRKEDRGRSREASFVTHRGR